jgi:hypothetical protein
VCEDLSGVTTTDRITVHDGRTEKVRQCMYFDNDFRKRKILRAKSCGVIGNRNATSKKYKKENILFYSCVFLDGD